MTSKALKILQVLPQLKKGGVEQSTINFSNNLINHCKVYIAALDGVLRQSLSDKINFINCNLKTKSPIKIIFNILNIIKIIKSNDIDIVHVHSRAPAWSVYFACKILNTPFICTYHALYSQNFIKFFYNKVMTLGAITITPSDFIGSYVKKLYQRTKTVTIPSLINYKQYDVSKLEIERLKNESLMIKQDILNSLKITNNKKIKIITIVARFSKIKGHKLLLEAIASMKNRQEYIVLFVGDGNDQLYINSLKREASNFDVQLVVFTDTKSLQPFYLLSDLIVLSTIKPESFAMVIAEAILMKKMVLFNNIGGTVELIPIKNTQYNTFLMNSSTDLRDKINMIFSLSDDLKDKIITNNYQYLKSNYDDKNIIKKYLNLMQSLV